MKIFQATIGHKRELCTNTFELELDTSPKHLDFKPGQYVWVQTSSGAVKAFSIATAPSQDNILKIAFRRGVSDYKQELLNSKTVTINGPFGFLELRDQAIFIVGGIGITPVISLTDNCKQAARLLYANSSRDTTPYLTELETLKPTHVVDRNITWSDIETISQGLTKPNYYVFGPEAMVKHVASLLFDHQISEKDIIFEEFSYTSESIKNQEVLDLVRDETFKVAVQSAFNHIIITDLNGKIVFANKAASYMTGFMVSEMIGQTPRLWGGLMDKEFYKKLWDTIKNKDQVYVGEITNRHKDGTTYITKVKISPIILLSSERVGFIGTEEDITHEKEVDKAKTEFVSLASHQLRTPLTSINWYIEMLESGDGGKLNEKQKDFLSEVSKGSHRMVQLVGDLLNVSRLETGRLKIETVPTDLVSFIKEVQEELKPQIREKDCEMSFVVPKEKLTKVNVDQVLFRQVIVNLLTNAIRYSSSNKKSIVIISLVADAHQYVISVKDNGIGIPKEVQGRIFEKFFRADNAQKVAAEGNGLGLYLARQIMTASGGTIEFTSTEEGTTFIVKIPKSGMISKEGEKSLSV